MTGTNGINISINIRIAYNKFCEGSERLTAGGVTNISVECFKDLFKRMVNI